MLPLTRGLTSSLLRATSVTVPAAPVDSTPRSQPTHGVSLGGCGRQVGGSFFNSHYAPNYPSSSATAGRRYFSSDPSIPSSSTSHDQDITDLPAAPAWRLRNGSFAAGPRPWSDPSLSSTSTDLVPRRLSRVPRTSINPLLNQGVREFARSLLADDPHHCHTTSAQKGEAITNFYITVLDKLNELPEGSKTDFLRDFEDTVARRSSLEDFFTKWWTNAPGAEDSENLEMDEPPPTPVAEEMSTSETEEPPLEEESSTSGDEGPPPPGSDEPGSSKYHPIFNREAMRAIGAFIGLTLLDREIGEIFKDMPTVTGLINENYEQAIRNQKDLIESQEFYQSTLPEYYQQLEHIIDYCDRCNQDLNDALQRIQTQLDRTDLTPENKRDLKQIKKDIQALATEIQNLSQQLKNQLQSLDGLNERMNAAIEQYKQNREGSPTIDTEDLAPPAAVARETIRNIEEFRHQEAILTELTGSNVTETPNSDSQIRTVLQEMLPIYRDAKKVVASSENTPEIANVEAHESSTIEKVDSLKSRTKRRLDVIAEADALRRTNTIAALTERVLKFIFSWSQ